MNQKIKKPIRLWQMIVLILLPASILVSSFFVKIRINADNLSDAYEGMVESVMSAAGDLLGGAGLSGMNGLNGMDLGSGESDKMRKKLEKEIKEDFTLTGWEAIFLSDEMLIEKFSAVSGEEDDISGEDMESMLEDLEDDETSKLMMGRLKDFLGYMRIGYLVLYIMCIVLIVMSIIWFVAKLNGKALSVINLIVSAGGSIVTAVGIFNMGSAAVELLEESMGSISQFGSLAGSVLDALDLSTPLRSFGIAVNMTFGGIGCMILCIVMCLFSIYMCLQARSSSNSMQGVPFPVPDPAPMPVQGAVSASPVGKIRVVKGEFVGAQLDVREGEEIILGRDPSRCHLVFHNSKISRKQCGIRYDPAENVYLVKNYSKNGTKFVSGQAVSSDVFVPAVPGNILLLANGREEIQLG